MAKISKRQRFGLYMLAVLVLIGGYVYLLYLPKEKEYDTLIENRSNKEVQLRKASIQAKNQERLKKEIIDLEDKLTSVKMQLPKEKEIPDLLKSIDAKGREANVDFLFFKPQPIIAKEFYGEVPITITVESGFHNLGIFLNKIAGLSRLINVSNIKISNISGKDEKITIKTEMIAKSYIYLENVPVSVK
ncbi:MAG: type 4a pilus biogenesis protein PilO [bacterium]|nr:type 4a pilus biogenesis protein PilO [bacterium]